MQSYHKSISAKASKRSTTTNSLPLARMKKKIAIALAVFAVLIGLAFAFYRAGQRDEVSSSHGGKNPHSSSGLASSDNPSPAEDGAAASASSAAATTAMNTMSPT